MEVKVKGFEDYTIDEFGVVRSYKYNKCRVLVVTKNTKGYSQVQLALNGKMFPKRVHRLVAETFIPNPLNLPQVNHIDGNKSNNCVENLEWCCAKDNVIHSWVSGLRENVRNASRISILKCHKNNSRSVALVDNDTKEILKVFESISIASKELFPKNDRSYVRTLIIAHLKDCTKGIKFIDNKEVFFMWGGEQQNVN